MALLRTRERVKLVMNWAVYRDQWVVKFLARDGRSCPVIHTSVLRDRFPYPGSITALGGASKVSLGPAG